VKHIWTDALPKRPGQDKRWTDRRAVEVPARLTWKDQRGATRFASVIVRDVSAFGVYVESRSPLSLPLFRLVQVQLERAAIKGECLPDSLQQGGRVLSAVYRVSPPSPSSRQGFALRLMIDPRRAAPAAVVNRATA
jgi:hypothetical protein